MLFIAAAADEMDENIKKSSKRNTTEERKHRKNYEYINTVFIYILNPNLYVDIFNKVKLFALEIANYGLCVTAGTLMLMILILYEFVSLDFGYVFHRICNNVTPLISILSGFYCLALYFRKSWNITDIYVIFCSCFFGEFIAQCLCNNSCDEYIAKPSLFFIVLLSVSIASVFSPLETSESAFIIAVISFTRYLSCTTLDIPPSFRPFTAYLIGICGIIIAKYMESTMMSKSQRKSDVLTLGSAELQDKVPPIRRRRSSAVPSVQVHSIHRGGRRTSLPALSMKQVSSAYHFHAHIFYFHEI